MFAPRSYALYSHGNMGDYERRPTSPRAETLRFDCMSVTIEDIDQLAEHLTQPHAPDILATMVADDGSSPEPIELSYISSYHHGEPGSSGMVADINLNNLSERGVWDVDIDTLHAHLLMALQQNTLLDTHCNWNTDDTTDVATFFAAISPYHDAVVTIAEQGHNRTKISLELRTVRWPNHARDDLDSLTLRPALILYLTAWGTLHDGITAAYSSPSRIAEPVRVRVPERGTEEASAVTLPDADGESYEILQRTEEHGYYVLCALQAINTQAQNLATAGMTRPIVMSGVGIESLIFRGMAAQFTADDYRRALSDENPAFRDCIMRHRAHYGETGTMDSLTESELLGALMAYRDDLIRS